MKRLFLLILIYSLTFIKVKAEDHTNENLIAFAKLSGYVKYFYPQKNKKKINWDTFVYHGVNQIVNISNKHNYLNQLRELFKEIAPELIIAEKDSIHTIILQKKYWNEIMYVKYKGAALDRKKLPFVTRLIVSSNKYKLLKNNYSGSPYFKNKELKENYIELSLNKNISCLFPVFLEHAPFVKLKKYSKIKGERNQTASRIAEAISIWNVFNNFFPYFDETQVNWDSVLVSAVDEVKNSNLTERAYNVVLQKMIASLDDGHAFISFGNKGIGVYFNTYSPFSLKIIDNKLVVTSAFYPLQRGDVIKKINENDIDRLLDIFRETTSAATNNSRDNRLLVKFTSYFQNKNEVLVIRNGTEITVKLQLDKKSSKQKEESKIIRYDNFVYINLHQLKNKEFMTQKESVLKSDGIIFDLRMYPSSLFTSTILPMLIDTTLELGNLFKPIFFYPNRMNIELDSLYRWKVLPNKLTPKTIPMVFLIGPGTISYGETCAEMIDYYKLGVFIGENTAGTNGDMNFACINNKIVAWTGNKFLKRDGSSFHTIGIAPDIQASSSIEDVKKGKDVALEKAILYLKSTNSNDKSSYEK